MTGYVYPSLADLAGHNGGSAAWDRAVQALASVAPTDPPHARSLGDSLTFRVTRADALARPELLGHRRYRTLLHPLDGPVEAVVAARGDLAPVSAYRGRHDAQLFAGAGRSVHLPAGSVLLVGVDEAWAVRPGPAAVAVLRLTVEADAPRPRPGTQVPADAAADAASVEAPDAGLVPDGAARAADVVPADVVVVP